MSSQPSLFSSSKSQSEKALTISSLNQQIKSSLEGEFGMVWVKGEISNFTAHSSGHHYFSLKDSSSQISAVMFRGQNSRLKFRPKDGMEVLVRGKITVYSPRGSYQLLCEKMDPIGAGGLQEEFDKLKNKLKAEGLFDRARKKPLPFLPFKIALVTSPTSAAVKDMIQVLGRRHPSAEVIVVPTLTQGAKAASHIIEALTDAENIPGVEVIIVGRGGGSIEDMWCFNDESLARKIFSMSLPVISGVGHEIDFTISDFVADLRAPTPSAAAELVCKNVDEIKAKLSQHKERVVSKTVSLIRFKKLLLVQLSKRLVDPRRKFEDVRLKVDDLVSRAQKAIGSKIKNQREKNKGLNRVLSGFPKSFTPLKKDQVALSERLLSSQKRRLEQKRVQIKNIESKLEALSPYEVLNRGYSIVTDSKTGKVIKESTKVKKGTVVKVKVSKGEFEAETLG